VTLRVLVTGGAGYVGSHVARALVARGWDVVVFDIAETSSTGPMAFVPSVRGDVRDTDFLAATLGDHGTEAVIHLAGLKSVADSLKDPGEYFDTNVRGSLSLCRAMVDRGVRHLVFSGSCAVYGIPGRLPVDESAEISPLNPYGESKALVERFLHWFDETDHLRFMSLRYFNAAGAALDGLTGEDWSRAVNLIPVIMMAALGLRGPVEVFGSDYPTPDGTAIRDYVHVVDLAAAHVLAVEHLHNGGASDFLNLGTGSGSSVLEVIREVERASGRKVPIEVVGRRGGDAPAIWADGTKARRVLGWTPRHGLRSIIETAWAWHASSSHDGGTATAAR